MAPCFCSDERHHRRRYHTRNSRSRSRPPFPVGQDYILPDYGYNYPAFGGGFPQNGLPPTGFPPSMLPNGISITNPPNGPANVNINNANPIRRNTFLSSRRHSRPRRYRRRRRYWSDMCKHCDAYLLICTQLFIKIHSFFFFWSEINELSELLKGFVYGKCMYMFVIIHFLQYWGDKYRYSIHIQ